jgi:hypothetical protein
MDYIDRLKRAAIPLGTIMVLSSSAALAHSRIGASIRAIKLSVTCTNLSESGMSAKRPIDQEPASFRISPNFHAIAYADL